MNLHSISQCPTPLNTTFFSKQNQNLIQRGIKQQILNKHKVKIDNQSPDVILAIMRVVFINNSADPYNDITAQVKFMNQRVIEMCARQITSGLTQFYGYLQDIDRPLHPPSIPVNTSVYGNKINYNEKIGL